MIPHTPEMPPGLLAPKELTMIQTEYLRKYLGNFSKLESLMCQLMMIPLAPQLQVAVDQIQLGLTILQDQDEEAEWQQVLELAQVCSCLCPTLTDPVCPPLPLH